MNLWIWLASSRRTKRRIHLLFALKFKHAYKVCPLEPFDLKNWSEITLGFGWRRRLIVVAHRRRVQVDLVIHHFLKLELRTSLPLTLKKEFWCAYSQGEGPSLQYYLTKTSNLCVLIWQMSILYGARLCTYLKKIMDIYCPDKNHRGMNEWP